MDNLTKNEKLKRFMSDKLMSNAVWDIIQTECLRTSKDRDVNNLASRFLAIEILNAAWHELEKFKSNVDDGDKEIKTPHV